MSLGISFYFQKFQSYGKAGWRISLLTPIKAERGTIHRDFSNSNIWLWKPELNMWNHTFTQNQLHAKKGLPMRSQKVRISCTHRRFFHPPSLKTTQKWSKYPQEYFLQNHFCICNFRDTEEEKSGENLLSYSPLVHKKLFLKEMCPSMFFDRWKNKSYKKKKIHLGQYLLGKPALHPGLKGEAAVQRSQVSSSTSLQADRTSKST